MRVLVLGAHGKHVVPSLVKTGDQFWHLDGPVPEWALDENPEWVVSFGHDKIISPEWIAHYKGHIINIHISALPYNRGADPNFWSWFDNTPKGVTIHQITKGLDTGPILARSEMPYLKAPGHTLRSSYDVLMRHAQALFADVWPLIRDDRMTPIPQPKQGTYHRQADKEPWMKNLPGWDATCSEVEKLGEMHRAKLSAA